MLIRLTLSGSLLCLSLMFSFNCSSEDKQKQAQISSAANNEQDTRRVMMEQMTQLKDEIKSLKKDIDDKSGPGFLITLICILNLIGVLGVGFLVWKGKGAFANRFGGSDRPGNQANANPQDGSKFDGSDSGYFRGGV